MATTSAVLEYAALIVGTAGTALWALGKNQLAVSTLWLLSSLLWIAFAQMNNHTGLTIRDLIGVGMYLVGIGAYWRLQQKASQPVSIVSLATKPDTGGCSICGGSGVIKTIGPGDTLCKCRTSTN